MRFKWNFCGTLYQPPGFLGLKMPNMFWRSILLMLLYANFWFDNCNLIVYIKPSLQVQSTPANPDTQVSGSSRPYRANSGYVGVKLLLKKYPTWRELNSWSSLPHMNLLKKEIGWQSNNIFHHNQHPARLRERALNENFGLKKPRLVRVNAALVCGDTWNFCWKWSPSNYNDCTFNNFLTWWLITTF